MPSEQDVLVLGAGSIGSRHARNLVARGARVWVTDPDADRLRSSPELTSVPFGMHFQRDYDGIVIATPTVHHYDDALECLAHGRYVFVEKPLALTSAAATQLAAVGEHRIMVGYNLRFHRPLQRIVDMYRNCVTGAVSSVSIWFGYRLASWRPGDYRLQYSAHAAEGGGVLLDAIHELDLLVWLFGPSITVLGSTLSHRSALDIDVEDTVAALLQTPEGAPIQLTLDYVSPRYRRGIEIVGEKATLRFDWKHQAIEIETEGDSVLEAAADSIDTCYGAEIDTFLSWIGGGAAPPCDAACGAASLRIADDIRTLGR